MGRSKKKKKKHLTGKTVLLCLFLVFFVYIGVNFIVNSGGSLTTYMAREGELSESFVVDGFIFKDQKILTAPIDGYPECVVGESGRIGKGGTVAYIYENDAPMKEKNRIKEIDEKIKELTENDRRTASSDNDSIRLELDISKEVINIPEIVRDKDIESLLEIRKSLDGIVEARKKTAGENQGNQELISQLKKEKAELEGKYDMTRTAVVADVAGSFTARVDGLESVLDDGKIDEVTQGYLNGITLPEKVEENEGKISFGSPVGKIVDTYTWYFAAVVEKDLADSLKVGDNVRLKFLESSDNIVNGSVYRIQDETDKNAVLIIKSAGFVDNLYSMSFSSVEIIKRSYEGMKVPAKSIRVKDGEKGVYILTGNKIKFRKAEIYFMNDEWAIVSRDDAKGLKLYDSVVVGGSNIYEGKVVR